ncbi:hypothetical protein EVAR_90848_1 [Eumeta japonica]|uniref:Uncharacterized protein n=1 Tax=Eumeta variegata TaxID=151549 RepID=A0A4C1ZWZ8_EUMVA|nr:hypothetical protein EVAR_90848_1 [Eumeta japonica]
MFTLDRLSQSMRYIEWAQRHRSLPPLERAGALQVLTHEQTLARERMLALQRTLRGAGAGVGSSSGDGADAGAAAALALERAPTQGADGECDVAPVENVEI